MTTMASHPGQTIRHPNSVGARLVRALRRFDRFRGWRRIRVAESADFFVVENDGTWMSGRLNSFIERCEYLYGGYELDINQIMINSTPLSKRRVAVDIGSNIGSHTTRLAKHFDVVHAFEPNPELWAPFQQNVELNGLDNVVLHQVGLSDADGHAPFFNVASTNRGMGTFCGAEQYDLPLEQTATLPVRHAGRYFAEFGIADVDLVKIDVQGLEPNILASLTRILSNSQPIVLFEVGDGNLDQFSSVDTIGAFFDYPVTVMGIARRSLLHAKKTAAEIRSISPMDVLIVPKSDNASK